MTDGLKARATRLLRWSEKYTKTDMVYLAAGGFWSSVGQITSTLSVLLLAMTIARFLPKEAYGEYKYVLSIVGLLGVFSLNGLSGAVFQSVAHGFDGALHEGFWKNLRWSIFMLIAALVVGAYYLFFGNYTLAVGILLGGCLSPFFASANLGSSFLMAKKDFARATIYYGIVATAFPAGALILTVFLTNNPLWLVAVYFLSNTISTVWAYKRTVHIYRPDTTKTDADMLTYGKHLSAMGILGTIASNIDQILLFHFVGAAQLAIYNFAIAIPDQAKGPLKTLDSMTQARFADHSDDDIRQSMRNKIFILLLSVITMIGIYVLLAPLIYHILFQNYKDAVFYSQIYAISILGFIFTPAGSYLQIKRRVKAQYITNVSSSVFQIGVMVAGVLMGGLLGLVIARVSARLFASYITYISYRISLPEKASLD